MMYSSLVLKRGRVKSFKDLSFRYSHGFLYDVLFLNRSWCDEAVSFLSRRGESLVDLGGGSGWASVELVKRGREVFYIDASASQCLRALRNQQRLGSRERSLFHLLKSDMRHFSLKRQVDVVFALNSGIEHLRCARAILDCFSAVYRVLREKGEFLFDVHYLGFVESQVSQRWVLEQNRRVLRRRVRVWRRIQKKGFQCFTWQHWIEINRRYHWWLETSLIHLSIAQWLSLLKQARFRVVGVWNDWRCVTPFRGEGDKLVFQLKKV